MESRRTVPSAGSTSSSSRRRRPPGARRPAPRKSLGQHYLTDRNIISRIADGAGLTGVETVVEIGAGPGDLTAELARRAGELCAVELDRRMVEILAVRFAGDPKVRIVEADATQVDIASLVGGRRYVAVGNLPYNAGGAIVRHLLESEPSPLRLVVMLQKEVADSILARPGDLSLAGIGAQVYAAGRKLFEVAPGSFVPPPRVRSAVIRLDVLDEPVVPAGERPRFFAVVRAGFSAPRKQLRNSLANGLSISTPTSESVLARAGIPPTVRAQELSIDDWLRVKRSLDAPGD